MEEIRITGTYHYSVADIKARLTEEGNVETWFEFKESGLHKPAFSCTPEEWDRLVAWVEWQRKDRGFSKGR